ncbi:hypothetical protein NMY22_g19292 [Coprinellus aureogranulatus]|nr:hypothetical protein NMY22_g19292 [Coprinellus aureogranulatus]
MSDSMVTFVTRFNGTNAAEWFDAMKAYLQLKGLWLIVNGDYEKPEEVASSAELEVQAARNKEIRDWEIDDGKARGAIVLRLTQSIANQVKDKVTSKDVWDALVAKYSRVGVSVIYSDFKAAVNFRITGNSDPRPEIAKLQKYLDRLEANKVKLPEFVKGMLLIGAVPQKWDNVLSISLNGVEQDKVTRVYVSKTRSFTGFCPPQIDT